MYSVYYLVYNYVLCLECICVKVVAAVENCYWCSAGELQAEIYVFLLPHINTIYSKIQHTRTYTHLSSIFNVNLYVCIYG